MYRPMPCSVQRGPSTLFQTYPWSFSDLEADLKVRLYEYEFRPPCLLISAFRVWL